MNAQTPLSNATDAELAAAVQENLYALFRAMAVTIPGGDIVESQSLCYHHTFPSNPMFKGVWQTHVAPNDIDASIEQTLAWFKAHEAPYIFWWLGLDTQPNDLPQHLQAHGFTPNIIGDPGMATDLSMLNEIVPTPNNFKIVQASNQKMLEDWRDVFCASYGIPLWAGQAWVDATLEVGISNAQWQLYVGYWNEKPVATNILFNGAGVASVYGVGVLPETRGKGIGAAITLKPLLDARALGYRYGVLFATEMGYPVYQRLGFKEVPCKIGRYLWINNA